MNKEGAFLSYAKILGEATDGCGNGHLIWGLQREVLVCSVSALKICANLHIYAHVHLLCGGQSGVGVGGCL